MTAPQWIKLAQTVLALGLLGWGAWWWYPPAAPVVVGGLLWLDLSIGSLTNMIATARSRT